MGILRADNNEFSRLAHVSGQYKAEIGMKPIYAFLSLYQDPTATMTH